MAKKTEGTMLLMQNMEEERTFVMEMVEKADEAGECLDLGTVTDSFVKKHDSSRKPSLFDAIRQLKAEGLIRLENHDVHEIVIMPG